MKKLLLTALFILVPSFAFAYTIPWNGTTTSGTILSIPAPVSSIRPIPYAPYFIASSTSPSRFPYASTTQVTADSICLNSDICRTTWPTNGGGGSSFWPFVTTNTNYGVAVQSTTTPEWFQNGLHASSTSQIAYASTTALTVGTQANITTLVLSNALTVANGGTGAQTLTGCLTGNGTGAITGSGTCNTSNATVSSVATNAGLTGGTITTTGTIGLDTTAIQNSSLLQYNGSRLAATGTPSLSVGYLIGTSTATSTFAGGVNMTGNDCFAIQGTCLQTYIQAATAYKSAANYATAAVLPGTPTYSNGSSGVGATLTELGFGALSVDGQVVSIGQRILVKNEATQANNGVYTVTATGSGVASYVLTRSTDFNTSNDVYAGVTVPVLVGGTVNGDTTWVESNTGLITIGTTNITFIESSLGTTPVTSVTATWPVISSGGTAPNITFGGLSTTTNLTAGQIPYNTGVNTFGQVATATVQCTGNVSCTSFSGIGSASSITLTGTIPFANGGTNSAVGFPMGLVWSNGSSLLSTSSTVTVGNLIGTTTATSTLAGGISATNFCLSGAPTTCLTAGGGGGSGTVSSGVAGQLAFYSSSGTTVVGSSSEQVTLGRFNATSTIASVFPYASTTAITSSGSAYFGTGGLNVAIGTSTPWWTLQMASATPYFAITDTNAPLNSMHWLISNKDGQLTFGTSTDTNTSTSTAMILDGNGQGLTVGSTTPVTASLALIAAEQSTETYSLYVAHNGSSTPSLVVNGVNGNGNVGIASTTPAAQFSVDGTSLFNNTLVNSSTASSTFYGGVDAKRLCLTGTATCLAAPTNFVSTTSVQALSTTTIDVSTLAPAHQFTILFHSSSTSATAVIGMCFNTCPSTDHYITSGLNMDGVATAGFENSTDSYLAFPATNQVAINSDTTIEITVTNIGNMWKYGIGRNINLNGNGNASQAQFYWKEPDPTVPITKISFTTQSSAKTFGAATFISVFSI